MDLRTLPQPFSRAEAEEVGVGRRMLDELLRLGRIRRLRRGWYVLAAEDLEPSGERWEVTRAEHLTRLHEHLRRLPGHVASHSSAALLHGLSLVISPNSPVELTALDRCPRSWREPGLVVHHSDSHDIPVTQIDGLTVTSLPRTAADTLRTRRLPHGTALVDQALRGAMLTRRELLDVLAHQKRWVGRPRALAAIALSDPARETWLESYSFIALYERGVAIPLPQVNVFDEDRTFLGRVDGLDPETGIFFEADGQDKYFLDVAAGLTPEQSVLRRLENEERRHEALEHLGLRGVRWTSQQILTAPDQVASRVLQTVQTPHRGIHGYVEWQGELRRLPFAVERLAVDLDSVRTRRARRAA